MAIGRKVAILGNMGELGSDECALHREVGTYCAEKGIDVVCGIGDLAKHLVEGASTDSTVETHWFESKADFLAEMKDIIHCDMYWLRPPMACGSPNWWNLCNLSNCHIK